MLWYRVVEKMSGKMKFYDSIDDFMADFGLNSAEKRRIEHKIKAYEGYPVQIDDECELDLVETCCPDVEKRVIMNYIKPSLHGEFAKWVMNPSLCDGDLVYIIDARTSGDFLLTDRIFKIISDAQMNKFDVFDSILSYKTASPYTIRGYIFLPYRFVWEQKLHKYVNFWPENKHKNTYETGAKFDKNV